MSTSIFRRIFLLHLALFLAAAFGVEMYITDVVRGSYIEDLTGQVSVRLDLMAPGLPEGKAALKGYCRQWKPLAGARVTVLDESGAVLCDSEREHGGMDNHAGRLEVLRAREKGTGASVRRSDTLGYDFLYVARRLGGLGGRGGLESGGFLRLAVPLVEVDRAVDRLRSKTILTVLAVLLSTMVFSLLQVRSLREYLGHIREFSHSIAERALGQKLYLSGAREFEEITEDLNAMSTRLNLTITEVEAERTRLGVILNSMPDALLTLDSLGTVTLASASASAFFGPEELLGRPYTEVLWSHEVSALLERVRKERSPASAVLRLGERHLLLKVSHLSFSEAEVSGFVLIFHDITRERQLEEVRRDFIANVSHELKTPITAIKGYSETLLEGGLSDQANATGFLKVIHEQADRMEALVEDLMTISRAELGVMKVEKAEVSLAEAARSVIALVRDKADKKGLLLEARVAEGADRIMADRRRLVQILTNLVDNALKFTEAGSVVIGAEAEAGSTVIYVQDTGAGIPAKHLGRLGERFYRVDPARSRKLGGTGLGLSIVKHLVRAQGWTLRIESEEGRGTRVVIVIEAPARGSSV